MRALLVMNPMAGESSPELADLLRQVAARHDCQLTLALPASPEELYTVVRHAVADGDTRIFCAGGDGTIHHVVAALRDTDTPLAIIPTGTVNVLARELHIPLDPLDAMRVALAGRTRRVDVGMANGRPFMVMAGLGFDAEVITEVLPRLKELFGPLAYVTIGLQVLARYKPSQFRLEMDELCLSLPAWLIVVGNASYYAYELNIAPDARMDDGLLDVCIFAEHGAFERLTQIGALFAGQHTKQANVRYFRTRHLRIDAAPPVHVQLDGDAMGSSPVDISVLPSALTVVVP
jgi:YegS/Rv2252/BmrU family lipid kinase